MFENNPVERDLVELIETLMTNKRRNPLHQATTFAEFIVPNKAFTDFPELVSAADQLVERLESELSVLKASTREDRDEALGIARAAKRDLRGFCVHAAKQGE